MRPRTRRRPFAALAREMFVTNNTPTGGSYHFQAIAICAKVS
jgi:hypothetical protein